MGKKVDKKRSYFGLTHESEIFNLSWTELCDYIAGKLIISIGEGSFRGALQFALQQVAAWAVYHEVNKDEK